MGAARLLDLAELEGLAAGADGDGIALLREASRAVGGVLTMAALPAAGGVPCVTAVMSMPDGTLPGFGCAAGPGFLDCATKAAMEAVQVHALLRNWARTAGPRPDPGGHPSNERERLGYLCGGRAAAAASSFVRSFGRGPGLPRELQVGVGLAAALGGEGVRPLVADLTGRLPEAVRALGWKAVKVLPLGLTPLRLNDSLDWNWCLGRFASGAPEPVEETRARLRRHAPHPLA